MDYAYGASSLEESGRSELEYIEDFDHGSRIVKLTSSNSACVPLKVRTHWRLFSYCTQNSFPSGSNMMTQYSPISSSS